MTGITKAFLQKFGKTKIQLGQKEQTHLQQDNDLKNGTHRVGCASSYVTGKRVPILGGESHNPSKLAIFLRF